MGEKPTAAFVLSLISGIFIIIGGLVAAVISAVISEAFGVIPGLGRLGGLIIILGVLGFVFGIIVIVGAIMINSGVPEKVKTGSIIVLVFSILSLFVGGTGGFIIGFILGLIGGILGLTWKPEARVPPPPPS
ncbi:MAG: hypothetical protein QW479_06865 [Desulfurococcaceae archaeon]